MSVEKLLEQFRDAALHPRRQLDEYLQKGEKVVLVAPAYTPRELIHSLGLVSMGAWGADIPLDQAKQYFPAFITSIAQSIVELGINGTYKGAGAMMVPLLTDGLKVLGENWRWAVPDIPYVPMVYPQNRQGKPGYDFVKASYLRAANDLEKIFGVSFSDAALQQSIAVYNAQNAVMRELSAVLAEHPEVTPSERCAVFKSAWFMKPEAHTALVRELLGALKESAAGPAKLRVVTSGILADSPSLLSILDENGLQVVADDIAAESRQYLTDAPPAATALDSLALKYQNMDNCSLLYDPAKKRVEHIVSLARERRAVGVLLLLTKFCDNEEFDYPLIKKACDAAQIPIMLIEVDRQMNNYEQARTSLETFKDLLPESASV